MSLEDVRARYTAAGQGHVLTFFDKLNEQQQRSLLEQLSNIDPERAVSIYEKALEADKAGVSGKIEPPPAGTQHSLIDGEAAEAQQWYETGLKAIGEGKVAVLLMAGGQGTRLGSSAPKGCFNIGLPSHKSLFQLQAERLEAVAKLAGGKGVPWYIMTSGPTRTPTEDFFAEHAFFGLERSDIIFFEQGALLLLSSVRVLRFSIGVLPAFDTDGKVLLESKSALAVAPDGNGGLYNALRQPLSPNSDRTVLSDMRQRGITSIHAYCVDNCLVRLADPVFMGYCITSEADCGNLVVPKLDPEEKVGVVARRDGKWAVIEYSEIPGDLAKQEDAQVEGKLAFRAGNIANHYFSIDFLEKAVKLSDQLAFHVARKKVPYVDAETGKAVKPEDTNAIKLEAFVCVACALCMWWKALMRDEYSFDIFAYAERMAILENARAECFSPLKNKAGTGKDDADTSRRDLLAQQRRWLEAAGADLDGNELELAPCISLMGEGLESLQGKTAMRSGTVETQAQLDVAFAQGD